MTTNEDIKRAAAAAGVKLWQIADAFGVTDATFSRKLRKEFSQEDKKRAFDAIEAISRGDVRNG